MTYYHIYIMQICNHLIHYNSVLVKILQSFAMFDRCQLFDNVDNGWS